MERLIVYETDKGNYAVRPEQWAGIIDKNGRIKECGLNHTAIFHYKKDAEWYADAKNAEEQGLLLRLPCKVGDVLWCIDNKKVESFVVKEFRICAYKIYRIEIYFENASGFGLCLFNGTLDEGWYRTKKEAEQALERMEKEK